MTRWTWFQLSILVLQLSVMAFQLWAMWFLRRATLRAQERANRLQDQVTDWMVIADGVAHDPRCDGTTEPRCLRCKLESHTRQLDAWRALVARSDLPCAYCGLAKQDMARCPSGFPGCGRADDLVLDMDQAPDPTREPFPLDLDELLEPRKEH